MENSFSAENLSHLMYGMNKQTENRQLADFFLFEISNFVSYHNKKKTLYQIRDQTVLG